MQLNLKEDLLLDNFVLVDCSGGGALQLLQGQTSADVAALALGKACFFTLCNAKGRMLANGVLLHPAEDCYRMLIDESVAETLMATLARYAPFYQVTLELSASQPALCTSARGCCLSLKNAGVMSFVSADGQAVSNGAEVNRWLAFMAGYGIVFLNHSEVGEFLPSDIGWDRFAVSFSKGCYTGQEIIARVHYRGKAKSRLFLANSAIDYLSGEQLLDAEGRSCGTVLRCFVLDNVAMQSSRLILAQIRIDALEEVRLDGQSYQWYDPGTP